MKKAILILSALAFLGYGCNRESEDTQGANTGMEREETRMDERIDKADDQVNQGMEESEVNEEAIEREEERMDQVKD